MKSSWPTKKLREIAEIYSGGRDGITKKDYVERGFPAFSAAGQDGFTKEAHDSGFAVILSSIGSRCGKCFYAEGEWTALANTQIIKFENPVTAKFMYYYLNDANKWPKSGTGQPFISPSVVKNLIVPFPPLSIQQKIVKILDTIQSAVEIQEKIIEKTKELKKSLMAELFKYGAPSFRNPEPEQARYGARGRNLKKTETLNQSELGTGQVGEIPEDWKVVRLGDVVNEMINGFPTGERDENGILQLRMDSITSDGKINLEAGVKVPRRIGIENYFLRKGDILFNNTNSIDLVGKTALFRGEFKECVFSNHLTRIRVDLNKTLPEWIFYILLRNWELKLFKNLATRRVGQADINRNVLKNLKLPLPSLPEQQEIAEILQTIDQKIEIEKKKKELYEELFKTMLNKIMNGEIDVEKIEV